MIQWRCFVSAALLGLLPSFAASAQESGEGAPVRLSGEGGRIPVQVVAGKLVVACDLSTPIRRIPVNLFIETDATWGLQLHNRAATPLGAERPDGTPRAIRVHFPDFELVVPKRELGDQELFEDFTKYHSQEIGENALVGSLGARVFAPFHLVYDLAAGSLFLSPPRTESPDARTTGVDGDTHTVPITLVNELAWLPVRDGEGRTSALALGSSREDTLVDAQEADRRGEPYGEIAPLKVGGIDLAPLVAFRPAQVVQVHPDGVFGVAGLNLLRHLRVEVDRVNRVAKVTPTAPARDLGPDRQFIEAMVDADPVLLEEFLQQHGEARQAPEAAELLLGLCLDELAPDEDCHRAIDWVQRTSLEDLRATRAGDLMLELSNDGREDLALYAGEKGVEAGRDDRYPNAVHELHARLGHIRLERGEGRQAWRHLLSAAFGLPEDGAINLDLGRYYESEGRHRRAFSRYVQAVIVPETGPAAAEALARVQALLPEDEPFSVDLIERMIEGKVRNFGAATRYRPDDEHPAKRTVLVEFFTNGHLGDERAGAIGGALGNQGLLSHFDPEHAVFLSYHMPAPQLDPLVNQLAMDTARDRGVGQPTVHVVDGVMQGPGAARWRQGEAVYNACRRLVLQRLATGTDYELSMEATVQGSVVRGVLKVKGPWDPDLRVHLRLAERAVLFPGKSTVAIHRQVARASLSGSVGLPFVPQDGVMEFPFEQDLEALSEQLEEELAFLEAEGMGATPRMSMRVDPTQVRLVAYVEDVAQGEILQAMQCTPVDPDAEEATR